MICDCPTVVCMRNLWLKAEWGKKMGTNSCTRFSRASFFKKTCYVCQKYGGTCTSWYSENKGSTKRTLCGIALFKLNPFFVMFLSVPSIDSTCFFAYVGFIGDQFFLLSTDSMYLCIPGEKGGSIFFRHKNFFRCSFYKSVHYNLYHLFNFTQNRPIFMQLYVTNLY
jgi:hypothetical protein